MSTFTSCRVDFYFVSCRRVERFVLTVRPECLKCLKMSHDRKCELDLEDASDNIINYKKLVKEQTGISVKEQMKKKKEKENKMGDAQNSES